LALTGNAGHRPSSPLAGLVRPCLAASLAGRFRTRLSLVPHFSQFGGNIDPDLRFGSPRRIVTTAAMGTAFEETVPQTGAPLLVAEAFFLTDHWSGLAVSPPAHTTG
jgi:hypothetical protein